MILEVTVNGTVLGVGLPADDLTLGAAGLGRMAAWQRLFRRLGGRCRYWQAEDPEITCFAGSVEIYPCRHGYLDEDRRWGTRCLVGVDGPRVDVVEFQILEGVYAAHNLYERFTDAASRQLGPPRRQERRAMAWQLPEVTVQAEIDRGFLNATFRLARRNGDGDGDGGGDGAGRGA